MEIYGYGPLENEYRALIERHSITGVNIHGPINSRAEYVDVLTSSDLLVAPCVRASNGDMDGIPTVLMEAMALGAAVAASRASSIPDLVIDGETGLLMRPGDVDDIARTIRSFFGMEEAKRAALLMRAAARVEAKCSVEAAMCGLLGAWTAPGRSWNPRDTVARPASRLGG